MQGWFVGFVLLLLFIERYAGEPGLRPTCGPELHGAYAHNPDGNKMRFIISSENVGPASA